MKVLVTGAGGFVGRNLTAALESVRTGKDRTRPQLCIEKVLRYTHHDSLEALERSCAEADFVFHLAGVNRPQDPGEFHSGNVELTERLLSCLRKANNCCPVMLASSVQASLEGRYAGSVYGESKREGERLLRLYGEETGAKILIYRFPNLFGKWCRPNYNSAVATFCYNIARDLPIRVDDPKAELELAYIDDVVDELLSALIGRETSRGEFCAVPVTHKARLGEITELLYRFARLPLDGRLPLLPEGSFAKKLYSTYVSYLPAERMAVSLKGHADVRGSFTEILRTEGCGQFSVNVTRPGVTKGQHWHHSKWELFLVVAGTARIREREIGTDQIREFTVSGEQLQVVFMLPGYTHSITNLSDTEDLVTLMWANECFDAERPDTFAEEV